MDDHVDVFATRFENAVEGAGTTLAQLAMQLTVLESPVTPATLSYWRSGRSLPHRRGSLRAVQHLETLLDVPPGWLLGALPLVAPGGWNPLAVLPNHPSLVPAIASFGLDLDRHMHTNLVRDVLRVGPDGATRSTRHLVRCESETLTAVPVVISLAALSGAVRLEGADGSLIDDVVELPALSPDIGRVVLGRLRLPRTLRRGERTQFGFTGEADGNWGGAPAGFAAAARQRPVPRPGGAVPRGRTPVGVAPDPVVLGCHRGPSAHGVDPGPVRPDGPDPCPHRRPRPALGLMSAEQHPDHQACRGPTPRQARGTVVRR